MFDKYLIVDDSLRNVGPADAPNGFAFEAKLGYYRGLGLSMVEALDVTVDGEAIPREAIRFDEGNGPLSLDEMETAFDRRWPFGASATITVEHSGGLAPGEHKLEFLQRLRVSYMPFPSINSDAKTLTVA
ncbi:C-glycoside deglycosidase beta subunit domain-containing protein [Shinella sp.]|uniref:C-glycoside deglycosidase beta subunit domain-containing protein n=1 Tax=Shinella sp. TaxID=1870904 RepID=UPI003F6E44BF